MPVILGLLAAIAAVYFFVIRARGAADMASEVFDAANDVRLAARRFGFRRQTNRHPVEDIEDPNVACAVVALAFIHLDGPALADTHTRLRAALHQVLELPLEEVDELLVLARWLVDQCNGAQPALSRAARKLYKIEGSTAATPMFDVLDRIASDPSARQDEARQDIRTALHLK